MCRSRRRRIREEASGLWVEKYKRVLVNNSIVERVRLHIFIHRVHRGLSGHALVEVNGSGISAKRGDRTGDELARNTRHSKRCRVPMLFCPPLPIGRSVRRRKNERLVSNAVDPFIGARFQSDRVQAIRFPIRFQFVSARFLVSCHRARNEKPGSQVLFVKCLLTAQQSVEIADVWNASRNFGGTAGTVVGELRRQDFPEGSALFIEFTIIPAEIADAMRDTFRSAVKRRAARERKAPERAESVQPFVAAQPYKQQGNLALRPQ